MADYLLSAHIQVVGGADAANQLNMVANAVAKLNSSGSGTNGMSGDLDKATSSSSGLAAGLSRVGDAVIRMGTYQGIRFVEEALRGATKGVLDFDQQMTNSLSIQSGVTEKMRGSMESLAESISVRLGEAPAEVAKGFYYLASAGLTVDQQMADLPVVANFAKAGLMDLDSATDMLFDSLSALGLKVADPAEQMQNLTHLSDLLVKASIDSMGTIEDFGQALQTKAGAATKAFGIDLNDTIALLEVFADEGLKGNAAGTAFSALIRDMTGKVQTHSEAWRNLGIQVFDANGKLNPLGGILHQIDDALLPMSTEQRRQALTDLGFTLKDMGTIMAVLGRSDQFDAFRKGLEGAGGVAASVAQNQMEALRAKLDQLKSVTLVFAIEGFDRLEQAAAWLVATFSPAASAAVEALQHLAAGAAPLGRAMAGIVEASVVEGLQGVAAAVGTVFGVISSHPGAVEALGAALAGLAAAEIVSRLAMIATAIGETLYLKALYAADAINGLMIKIMTLAETEGLFAALTAGLQGFITLLTSPVVVFAGVGIALFEIKQGLDRGKASVDEFKAKLEQKYDVQSLDGLNNALREMKIHVDDVRAAAEDRGIFATWADVGAIREADKVMKDMNEDFANAHIGISLIAQSFTGASTPVGDWANRLKDAGLNIKDFPIADLQGKIKNLGGNMSEAGQSTDGLMNLLTDLAKKSGIDIRNPIEEWVPKLAEAYVKFQGVRDLASEMGGVAAGSEAGVSSMEEAIGKLADKAASAEDKLKALKQIMDGLSGGKQNEFDMTTRWAESMERLQASMSAAMPTFFTTTEAGRKQRDALSDAADAARDLALAHAESSGNMQAGADELKNYAAGLTTMLQNAHVADSTIRDLLTSMGLAPEQIDILFKITQPKPDAQDVKKDVDAASQPRDVPINPHVDQGALDTAAGDLNVGSGPRTVPFNALTEPGPLAIAQGDLNAGAGPRTAPLVATGVNIPETNAQLDQAKVPRPSEAHQYPTGQDDVNSAFATSTVGRQSEGHQYPTGHPEVEGAFNTSTRGRQSQADQYPTGYPGVEGIFQHTTRGRQSQADQYPTGWSGVSALFDAAARARTSVANQTANTGSAEGALNSTARDRFSTIHVNVVTTGTVYAGPNGTGIAEGGIVHAYASGGFENHVAQIGRLGHTRIWNEPETGGEAYIPLAMSKRDRSLAIWEETGKALGVRPNNAVTLSAPINVTVNGASDPTLTAQTVATHVKSGVDQALQRVLIELGSI